MKPLVPHFRDHHSIRATASLSSATATLRSCCYYCCHSNSSRPISSPTASSRQPATNSSSETARSRRFAEACSFSHRLSFSQVASSFPTRTPHKICWYRRCCCYSRSDVSFANFALSSRSRANFAPIRAQNYKARRRRRYRRRRHLLLLETTKWMIPLHHHRLLYHHP